MTRRELNLLEYIKEYISAYGLPPSFQEMMEAFGLKSKSGVHRMVKNLEEQGYIRRLPMKARCIEVVENPTLPTDPSNFSIKQLAAEAKRRHLVLGHLYSDTFVNSAGHVQKVKRFVEIIP
jgi:SOS-response transcriptional repressor LexA